MKEIILVQPKAGDNEFVGIRQPDSLLAIAGLPVQQGYKVEIIDQRTDKNWKQHLKQRLNSALCVGTTAMTGPQIKYALEISKFVKENSNTPVIWGGVHASLLPEQTLKNRYIDIVVKGEGDYTFFDIIKALEKNKNELKKVKGIYYKSNGKIKKTPEREFIKDLDKLPRLPYELINLKNYFGFDIDGRKSITMSTSRGCPSRCSFCYNVVYNKNTWRGMSAKKTIAMIKNVVERFGVRGIYFQDDNFCVDLKRFEKIVDGIIKERIDIIWGLMGVRIDSVKAMTPIFLKKLLKAGCTSMEIGVESGSQRILNLMAKGIKIQDVLTVNKKLAKHFSKVKYTYIMGIPTETESELLASVKLALRLEKDNPRAYNLFNVYCVYPGTRLYNFTIKHGFKEPRNLEKWATVNYEHIYSRYPWLDKKRISMLKNFRLTSYLRNKNVDYKMGKNYAKVLATLYRPIAKFRFRHNFHHFFIEKKIYELLYRLSS